MQELFFSATPINRAALIGTTLPAAPSFLWAIWDIYPSIDVRRPPILSGIEGGLHGLLRRAEQYDIRGSDSGNEEFNARLVSLANDPRPIASIFSRPTGLTYLAVWSSAFHYLIGQDPILEADALTSHEARRLATDAGADASSPNSGYARMRIRKLEAIRRYQAPAGMESCAMVQEFLYADHHEKYISGSPNWKRHRIVRKTADTVFVDRFPYCTNENLRRGWQAHVVFTAMVDRKALEGDGKYYHRTLRTHFVHEALVKSRAKGLFDEGGPFAEPILDLPTNEVQWAVGILGLDSWPATPAAVKRAFAKSAMTHHPDRGGDPRRFIECRAAREILLSRACC